jgi:hypothetical protein
MAKRMIVIYDRDNDRYFIGWNGESPLWSDEISGKAQQLSRNQADDNYELL